MTDYMVISTGNSDRHVRAQTQQVIAAMDAINWKPAGVEGEDTKDWVLIDFVDIVVHVMKDKSRAHYDLESLWDKSFSDVLATNSAEEVMRR